MRRRESEREQERVKVGEQKDESGSVAKEKKRKTRKKRKRKKKNHTFFRFALSVAGISLAPLGTFLARVAAHSGGSFHSRRTHGSLEENVSTQSC